MRVALVINTSWNIYNFRMGLIRALMEEGHEMVCIAPTDVYSDKIMEEGCRLIPFKMDSRGVNPMKDLALFFELRKIYKEIKPDIILHYTIKPNIYGTLAARSLKIPVINNVCGLGSSFIRGGIISSIVKQLYKFSFKYAQKVFFQNEDDIDLFTSQQVVDSVISETIPGSGINTMHFKPKDTEIKDRNDHFTFLMISRIIIDKGVYEYIEAARKLKTEAPAVKFQILGQIDNHSTHGIAPEIIQKWIDDGVIEYLGTADDVRPYISGSDCVVLPSYREGTPRSLLEASGMAKPVISTNTAGCRQVVEDNISGLLCEPKSAESLFRKMKEMIELPIEKRAQMGSNGRQKIMNEYDENLVITKYSNSIQEIAASR